MWCNCQVWRAFYTVYLDVWNFRTFGGTRIDRCVQEESEPTHWSRDIAVVPSRLCGAVRHAMPVRQPFVSASHVRGINAR